MSWNWQQADWPDFSYKIKELDRLEQTFMHKAGFLLGCYTHFSQPNRNNITIDLLSDEAYCTSQIEGEYLNRDSLRSSISNNLGLTKTAQKALPAETGMAEMRVSIFKNYEAVLTANTLFEWHLLLTRGRRGLHDVGRYRTHAEAMQVVSGNIDKPKVHFEAPSSKDVPKEMEQFILWFNKTAPNGSEPLPPLVRASICHLYFVCIHPFEDGNGRIGRALVEKALSQALHSPVLIALSHVIQKNKKAYYSALESANKSNEISAWIKYFANTIIAAQDYTQQLILFLIAKTKMLDRIKGHINSRQERVIVRMFEEGLEGFKGGLSAENYIRITKTSRATATRDLPGLPH